MGLRNWKVTYKGIFLATWVVVLISRILVLTNNYIWPIDAVLIEIVYLVVTVAIVIMVDKGKIRIRKGKYLYVLVVLLIHTVLWGNIFTDELFSDLITKHFKSQIMFVVILCVTVWAVQQLGVQSSFLKCGYYALSSVLLVHFMLNYSEVDLSNLANIMSATGRTRANFGFGHYNTLGAACVCNIIMREVIKKQKRNSVMKCVDGVILMMSLCMLLCSASRSALTSLVLYFLVYYGTSIDEWHIPKMMRMCIKVFAVFFVGVMGLWSLLEVDFLELLVAAQRSHLFSHSIPAFIETGKIWLGLGYASNVSYASGLTPYTTYWLDNAYVYYLITTGIVGLTLLLSGLVVLGYELRKKTKSQFGMEVFAAFVVYIYISMFEAMLFSSGGLVNYMYLPWFLNHISTQSKCCIG